MYATYMYVANISVRASGADCAHGDSAKNSEILLQIQGSFPHRVCTHITLIDLTNY